MLTEEQQKNQQSRPWQLQSETTDMKRVAWPPTAAAAGAIDDQTSESHESNDYGSGTLQHNRLGQASPNKVAPPVPPKPGREAAADHQGAHGTIARRNSSNACPPSATQFQQQPGGVDDDDSMALPQHFASNELIGERQLIAKPAPPPGLILGRPLKKHTPISQEPNAVFDSQPVFKRATPVRMLGDMVWPPVKAGGQQDASQTEPNGPVRRQEKNYRGFFGQHQLPANFPTYRAPPGTQHFGLEEGENATPM